MRSSSARSHGLLVSSFVMACLAGLSRHAAASGFDEHLIATLHGNQPGASFGSAVATAEDVNGDGFPDLVVGAPNYNGAAGGGSGKVSVFYGAAAGFQALPSWTAEGELPLARFGSAVLAADVNGDGLGDVVVGSPGYDPPSEDHFHFPGRMYVYLGSAQGLSTTAALIAEGHAYDLGFREGIGGALATGDFNADGFADVVGAQYAAYFGGGTVYYGSAAGPTQGHTWPIPDQSYRGNSVAAADVNGDGFDDLIVTNLSQEFGAPQASVYLGSPTGLPVLASGEPPAPAFVFDAWSNVAKLGDLDRDGYDDILVVRGDPWQNQVIYHALYRGSPTGPVPVGDPSGVFGVPGRLVPLGDFNGDGFPDAMTQDGTTFYVYFGTASGFNPISDGMGTTSGLIAAVADVDQDGFADIAVSDPAQDRVGLYRGGTDWSFTVRADIAVHMEFNGDPNFWLSATNQGPDPARVRLLDVLPRAMAGAGWFCWSGGSVASQVLETGGMGDMNALVTMPPGGRIDCGIAIRTLLLPIVNTVSVALPEWVLDPDLSNNTATVTAGPPEVPLFADGFESGSLQAWSGRSGRGLVVSTEAALEDVFGLQVTARRSGPAVVRDDTPDGEGAYHARFRFDASDFRAALPRQPSRAILFSGRSAAEGRLLFVVALERKKGTPFKPAGTLILDAGVASDDQTMTSVASAAISDAPHLIEVGWRRATGPDASDGLLVIRLDGVDIGSLSSVDNDAVGGVDSVELGLTFPESGHPRPGPPELLAHRTVLFDSFASWRMQ
jgi:hypothetical protein